MSNQSETEKNTTDNTKKKHRFSFSQVIGVIGLILFIALAVVIIKSHILTDKDVLENFIESTGIFGYAIFVLIQIIQVIIPILPGGVTCALGVVLYGPVWGFIANYVGICTGSILGFGIARFYGRKILFKLFKPESIAKYDKWTTEKKTFSVMFGIAMFLPGFPDDLICFLAGTTEIPLWKFITILLSCKIFAVLLYSLAILPFDIHVTIT